ncbi:MAG: type II secretion system protein [Planctomycetes bacterium]|nr:type II secretion system protein [Planctomycetota bacterium]
MNKRGITLVELLAIVAIASIVIVLVGTFTIKSRQNSKKKACQSNLSSIAKSLKLYGGEFNDSYPWICSDSDYSCAYNFRSNMQGLVPSAKFYTLLDSGSGTNHQNICENLNLLPGLSGMIAFNNFLCPASDAKLYPNRSTNCGFFTTGTPRLQCQYGYHAGWKYIGVNGLKNPAPLDANLPGDFVIMADMNPGKDCPLTDLNSESWTHGKNSGINILRANGSVSWSETVNCDLNNHSIYMAGTTASSDATSTTPSAPLDKNDSVLYVSGQ